MGARPFFYMHDADRLYFSNTLNAIRCVPDIASALDHHFIGDFLVEGYCPDPALTAFGNVSRLPAGYALRYSTSGLDVRRHMSMPIYEPLWLKREQEYVETFRELLDQAVLERLPSGPTAIFMSGGLDSTSIAAIAMKNANIGGLPLGLRAFNVDYRPTFDDGETSLTSLAARQIGIPLEVLCGASYVPYGSWNESPPPMPEPCHEPYQALQVERFRQAAKYSPIVLNGYGGDGVMSGQSWPYLTWLLRHRRFGKIASDFGSYILRHGRIPLLRAGLRSAVSRWFRGNAQADAVPAWLAPKFESELRWRPRDPSSALNESFRWGASRRG